MLDSVNLYLWRGISTVSQIEPVCAANNNEFGEGNKRPYGSSKVRTNRTKHYLLSAPVMPVDESKRAQIEQTLKERDEWIRESWVKAMEARIVRDNLEKCYRVEGVNHYEKCRDLSEKYQTMLKENRVKGYKQIDV